MSENDALLAVLKALIAADYDAILAYRAAVDRLSNDGARSTLQSFQEDHERHVEQLSAFMAALGVEPPQRGDLMGLVAKGRVMVGNVVGDQGILAAMRSNEDDSNLAYERALTVVGLPEHIRRVLEANLADERRHRGWIDDRVRAHRPSTMPPPAFGSA
ncbi:MAG: DUF2383 domain-containing protein [Polyangiaceae bacterium]|nr:DUF2383 domain-containing protein [Polyangiaceae bacterium]